jgi:demethylmenaquinone methyltransferase/2-methoxy-6-polyprenyl-1,4-benzoquinol methylase
MFGAAAPRYDFLNHLLSAGLDRRWRARAAAACAEALVESRAARAPLVLDLCCGTGDLAVAVLGRCLKARVIACDFSPPMLERAARKFARVACGDRAALVEADALALPLPDASVDAVTCGFGLRNLADAAAGLAEMLRVLRPGGPAVILEFHQPQGRGVAWATVLGLYFRRILPRLGAWISGGGHGGYSYLVASIEAFGPPEATARAMAQAGLAAVRTEPLAGGIASVYVGLKPA